MMSISTVGYKQAAQVAAIAIAVAAVPPVGIVSTIGSLALGAIGYFSIEIADKIKEDYKAARDSRLHRIVPLQDVSPKNREKELKNAIERFREEKGHEWLGAKPVSLEEECAQFQEKLEDGCCHGFISTLFDGIEKKGLSIEQSASAITTEEVFFHQLVQRIELAIEFREEHTNLQIQTVEDTQTKRRTKNAILFFAGCLNASFGAMLKELEVFKGYEEELIILKEKLQRYNDEKTHLKEIDPLLSLSLSSREFTPELSHHSYQHILEKTIQSFPLTTAAIRGTVTIPKHVMAFQYGPEGYYIYDSFSSATGGLLKYSDKTSFFKKLRALVLATMPTLQKMTDEKMTVSFHVHSSIH